jgi:hypothetical protein
VEENKARFITSSINCRELRISPGKNVANRIILLYICHPGKLPRTTHSSRHTSCRSSRLLLKHMSVFSSFSFSFNPPFCLKIDKEFAGRLWRPTVILTTQEAEIRRIAVQRQHRQIVRKTLSQKNKPSQK